MEKIKAGVWLRVSTTDQASDNQRPDIDAFCAHHGYSQAQVYTVDDSVWKNGGGKQFKETYQQALADAHAGKFSVLVIWSLDRIVRTGAEEALRVFRQFNERGVAVASVKEDWLRGSPEVQEILIAFAGWMAKRESDRKSERVVAALARRKAAGLPVGRQPGAVDKKPRKRSPYHAAWEPGGARRRAQEARRTASPGS